MPYVERHIAGTYILHGRGHGKEGTLYQRDWDYPSLARDLGWSLARVQRRNRHVVELARRPKQGCDHDGTDGTIDCRECGVTARQFMTAASNYLDRIAR